MTQDTLAFAQEQIALSKQVALVTVTKTNGSSPASAGQMIAVLTDGTTEGTIGGGASEYAVIQQAIQAMQSGQKMFQFSMNHAESGMVCGGGMEGFGNVLGNENHLYIFGGGHVAQSLAPLAVAAGFYVTVVEDRPELAEAFSGVQYLVCTPQEYEEKLALSPAAYVVVSTRGHKTDDDALRFCLGRPLQYVGMIGSRKKVHTLFSQLLQEGYSREALQQVYAPIGLDIASGIPAEIAVSILAEILMIKNNGSPNHKRKMEI